MKNFLFSILSIFLAISALSCIKQGPTTQYASSPQFAAAYVYDEDQSQTSLALLDSTPEHFNSAFTARKLAVSEIPFNDFASDFAKLRDSNRRSQSMKKLRPEADVLVLVELKAVFYSQLGGRYRWDVKANISLTDPNSHLTLTDNFSLPAVLMFAHEKGDTAINTVKEEIARRLGSILDSYMRGKDVAPAQSSAPLSTEPPSAPPATDAAPQPELSPDIDAASPQAGAPAAKAVYFVLVDRFFNAQKSNDQAIDPHDPNAWHGGDIAGVTQKLDYLENLGITDIWLSPIFLTAQDNFFGHGAFHAYWTYDLNRLEPRFGTEDELRTLAREAQKRGIGIILDFVVNHVGYQSPWVKERPSWFHTPKTIQNWDDPQELVQGEVHGLPDLNQDNPEVYSYLKNAANKWLQIPNIVGFRLDAVKHVPLSFWQKFNTELARAHKNLTLLAEMFDGSPYKVTQTQQQGAFTNMFDFPLAFALRDVFCEHKSLANLASVIDNDRIYQNPASMVTFVDNHDMPRLASLCKTNAEVQNALTTLLALRGLPSIYYGTESALKGSKEPENRADMDFANTPNFSVIQNGLKLRRTHPVLVSGKTAILHFSPQTLIIARENTQEQALILINQATQTTELPLPEGSWTNTAGRSAAKTLPLAPQSVQILTRTRQASLIDTSKKRLSFSIQEPSGTYAIVGSAPEFGLWNPDKGLKINAGERVNLELPSQSVVSYKLVRQKPDGSWEWEQGPNRELFTSAASKDYRLKW